MPVGTKNIAIVILNWNGAAYLKRFLPSLLKHTPEAGVTFYVADNGSTDHSIDVLRSDFPSVKVILLDRNYGFAGGYNKALAQINADYYVILNSDVELTPGWLSPMLNYLEENPKVVACQPKILAEHNRNIFEHAGAAGGFIDFLGYPFCRGRILAELEADHGQYDEVCEIFWATGACLMIRADVFHAHGGFDDRFFAHMEEIDLCWRLKSRGMGIVCVPQSKVYHVGGGTLNVENPHKTYLNFRNNLLLLYKNLPAKRLFYVLTIRFFLDYVAALQLFITGKPANAAAVLKARRDFSSMKRDFKSSRLENLQKSLMTNIPEIFKGSVILDYYFLRIKKFSQLKF
jgi:GT2 family glycosyltransferase